MGLGIRHAVVVLAGLCLAVGAGACGLAREAGGSNQHPAGGLTIGLLLPDYTSRMQKFDKPLVEKRIQERCPACRVEFASAQHDVATQQAQVDAMITKGVKVMILDAVDSRSLRHSIENAHRAGIKVIAYDRLAEGPISGYVSFDGDRVGRLQGQELLRAMGAKAHGGQIVMMNGDVSDPNSAWFRQGALAVLRGRVHIGKAYETTGWRPEVAHTNMSGAISALGADRIDGVLSANDGLAAGVISAMKAAKMQPLPPVTGQDVELSAIQRIVRGEQYMSVYKPFVYEANAAADMAVALVHGKSLAPITRHTVNSPTTRGVPAVLLTPIAVTVHNVKGTLVKDGMYTVDQICTPPYAAACAKAGLTR
ncbi:sugar ABC transporter substrate-binding protein [Streptomyces natalensis]|uniref:ABC transporter substrate-binding protein n=1 Tax=Streptomyces natalensis ATCC 27448 TaxID=1240678 RepID=A0A0D7CJL1_9ACTN|nr:substrate-binding domain-containing protein [Streptomyces natalensis]KIZ16226.1 ABC transporter substrate-binding protein [Streptomyces natalensis ATCC 27448]